MSRMQVNEPLPLRREGAAPEKYPVKALGKVLGDAVDAIQCPVAIAAQSVLSAAALAFSTFSIFDEISSTKTPTLALNGALDIVVPHSAQHVTAMALPKCKEVIFSSERHMLPNEAPELCAPEIFAFWDKDVFAN